MNWFRKKLTRENLERYIQDYLNENGFKNKKDEGDIVFTIDQFHIRILINQRTEKSFNLYFTFVAESNDYRSLYPDRQLLFGALLNEYKWITSRIRQDCFTIDIYYDLETLKTFDLIFKDVVNRYREIWRGLQDLLDDLNKEQAKQQAEQEEVPTQDPPRVMFDA